MAPPLLALQDIHLTLGGGGPLLNGAEISVGAGERICLVGRNGSGKSTLLKIAAGLQPAFEGKRFMQPGATIRYLAQEPDFAAFNTVLEYVEAGLGPGDDPYRAHALLEQVALTGDEHPSRLSGGESRRAMLVRALAPAPDLLLLDEPTNHLDLPAIEWLEAELASMRSGIVLISHDRRMLESVSKSIVWLDRGVTKRVDRGFAQARAQDCARGGLDALRRHCAAQAQCASCGGTRRPALPKTRAPRACRIGASGGERERRVRQTCLRRRGNQQILRRPHSRARFFHAHRAWRPRRHHRP
jgi:ATPase subunit of ABC transporter with duplicated ATPase domains